LGKKVNLFSSYNRDLLIEKLKSKSFDLIIIGGGITGAGVCIDAISRGLSVCLIEMNDFASGTSSKSTKLIHGGLRYLEQFKFSLVRETGTERAVLHEIAPHVVKSEKMLLPISKDGKLNRFTTPLALSAYDFLAKVDKKDKNKSLDKESTCKYEPLLKNKNILGGAIYSEYRTDDSRLTLEILKKSYSLGAYPINYAKHLSFIHKNGKVKGLICRDQISGKEFKIKSKVIVNASGSWLDEITGDKKSKLILSKGVHVVIPKSKFPIRQSIYFDAVDERMIFAIPRRETVYIGTTDTLYNKSIDRLRVKRGEVSYLIKSVNKVFKSNLKIDDVVSSWVGLRPLIKENKKDVSEISRKDEIFISGNGLISIAGGKLTGYRKMAERVVQEVIKKLKLKYTPTKTDKIKISNMSCKECANLVSAHFNDKIINSLYNRYGSGIIDIYEIYIDLKKDKDQKSHLLSELIYCIKNEMCHNLSDFFSQRNSMVYFNINEIRKEVDMLKSQYCLFKRISKEEFKNEEKNLYDLIKDISTFI
tara:strand:- start:2071 stop:3669 length:1599 start_codon:yes stop_codon:yes gene_type:complete